MKRENFLFRLVGTLVLLSTWSAMATPVALPPVPQRPEADSGPTKIQVSAWFSDITKIDSAAQNFSASLFVVIRWKDPAHVRSEPGVKTYPLGEVWHPRFEVSNAGNDLRNTLSETVDVAPDGEVIYRQRLTGSFNEALNLWRFPFDSETFAIKFVILGSRPEEININPDPDAIAQGLRAAVGRTDSPTIQDWRINSLEAKAEPYRLAPGMEIAGYTVSFNASRERQHYILKVILPLVLIVFMAFSVFWIDPTLGASQISVAVTSMLTLIAYRFAIGADTPKLPYLTLMDAFILLGTLLVFLSLVEVMITTRLALTDRVALARAIDRRCRLIFPVILFTSSAALYFFW